MNQNTNLGQELPKDAYMAFDALTLKDFIIKRLSDSGKFTDQIYEGSNLSSIIDIIAYSYNTLLFYMNNSASELTFDQAILYENMNRIIKLVGYKPTGMQTSIASVDVVVDEKLPINSYTIRKFSYINVNGINYNVIRDYDFDKTTTPTENIEALSNTLILYQGTVTEYETQISKGKKFEVVTILDKNIVNESGDIFIADNTISVYIKEIGSGKYYEYTEVDNLYLHEYSDRVYERRLNEFGMYELKFGNGSSGRMLESGDEIAIYYIKSDNQRGLIGVGALSKGSLTMYSTDRFNKIYNDLYKNEESVLYINASNTKSLKFNNKTSSSPVSNAESVEDMRDNVPKLVASQMRLVNNDDYEAFIKKILGGSINDVKIFDNASYMKEYLGYFYNMCVDPSKNNRVLVNQAGFADTCDFNNVNVFCVPAFKTLTKTNTPPYVSEGMKRLIVEYTEPQKILGSEVVPRDPVYMAFAIHVNSDTNSTNIVYGDSTMIVTRHKNAQINKNTLKSSIINSFIKFFDPINNKLGQYIDLSKLSNEILSIGGIKNIKVVNNVTNAVYNGVCFVSWNPLYSGLDVRDVKQNLKLDDFKFPYLYNAETLATQIKVVDE